MNVKQAALSLVLCLGCLPLGMTEAAEAKKMSLDDCKAVLEKLKTDGKIKRHQLDPARAGLLKLDLNLSAISDLTPLKGMPIESLSIDGNDQDPSKMPTLAGLEGMPLKDISMMGTIALTDISALKGAPLKTFKICGTHDGRNPPISDISVLKGMDLVHVTIGTPAIKDLSPLAGMKLKTVSIACGSKDVNVLKGMPLDPNYGVCLGGEVTDLSGLQGMPLKNLGLHGAHKLMDLSPLKGMPLERIDMSYGPMESLHGLEGMPLKNLLVPANVRDLTPLRDIPTLEGLSFQGNKYSDITPLMALKKLTSLDIRGAPISNVDGLKGLPLTSLSLMQCKKLTDIGGLKGMPLVNLNLYETQVKDISPLAGSPLKSLNLCACTNLTDLKPLAECKDLQVIGLPRESGDIEFLRKMPKLKALTTASWDFGQAPPTPAADFWKKYDEGRKK